MTSSSPPGDPLRPRRGEGDYRHRPAGVRQLHHDRGGPPSGAGGAAGSERFEQYQREVATNTYSFDRVFARGLRLESQFEMLMEILDEGSWGSTSGGGLCLQPQAGGDHRHPLRRGPAPPAGAVYPFLPFARCLKEKAPARPGGERRGVNINVAVAPVLRGTPASAPSPRCSGSTCGEPAERAAQPASPQGLPGQVYL